jgi:hypothetical protein
MTQHLETQKQNRYFWWKSQSMFKMLTKSQIIPPFSLDKDMVICTYSNCQQLGIHVAFLHRR